VHQLVVQRGTMVCSVVSFAVQHCLQVLLLSYLQDAFIGYGAVGSSLPQLFVTDLPRHICISNVSGTQLVQCSLSSKDKGIV